MSEQVMNAEMVSPRERAVAYLEYMQGKRVSGNERQIKTPKLPEKVERTSPLVDTVAAYEAAIDRMAMQGDEHIVQAMEQMRPDVYRNISAGQQATRIGDYILTAALWLPASNRLIGDGFGRRVAGTWGMLRYRPLEWVQAQVIKNKLSNATPEKMAPVVDRILGGGKRMREAVKNKPVPPAV